MRLHYNVFKLNGNCSKNYFLNKYAPKYVTSGIFFFFSFQTTGALSQSKHPFLPQSLTPQVILHRREQDTADKQNSWKDHTHTHTHTLKTSVD